MKITIKSLVTAILGIGLFLGCAKKSATSSSWSLDKSKVSAQLKNFVAEKELQANTAAKTKGKEVPEEFKSFFAAAAKGDCHAVTNFFNAMLKRGPQYGGHDENMRGPVWQTVMETAGAFELFANGIDKYAAAFGNDVIKSIPDGSVYFGGTDHGRFLVTALSESHADGKPFFTLTQNALADMSYLDYLRLMYGDKIQIPSDDDLSLSKCFRDYVADAQRRMQNHQLKPGENVNVDSGSGRVQVSGQAAVMGINGLLAKIIFDQNTNQEFYVEESFPLDWMYPHLEPHGLIMKINRQPLSELSGEKINKDSDYWAKYMTPMIGGWLKPDTTVGEVAAFAEKIHVKKDLSGFVGDPQFVQNEYSCKMFSKLRSSIGGLYAWRAQHATDAAEKQRMNEAADFAFRQAWALCPYSTETAVRYVNLLTNGQRYSDALQVSETTAKMPEMKDPGGATMRDLIKVLQQMQQRQKQK
ncbi:MAG TPA: hypothetical protein VE344_09075 [Methylomirabilota bacterium]|nr:hypothetical protein [Methylomirabilota bacterium]